LGKGFSRRKSLHSESETVTPSNGDLENHPVISGLPAIAVDGPEGDGKGPGTPSPHNRNKSWGAQSIASRFGASPGDAESGNASLSILSASGFPSSANIQVHIKIERSGKDTKDVHKTKAVKAVDGAVLWAETEAFKTPCAADSQFHIVVKDHSTFGRDEELGEGKFFLSDQGKGSEQTVTVGSGKVTVRSSFTPADAMSQATSPKSKLGRGMMFGGVAGKRDSRDRSVTPSGS